MVSGQRHVAGDEMKLSVVQRLTEGDGRSRVCSRDVELQEESCVDALLFSWRSPGASRRREAVAFLERVGENWCWLVLLSGFVGEISTIATRERLATKMESSSI